MAALYLAQRIAPGGFVKQVVLKRLRPELDDSRDAAALFLREASLAATLEHPAIVRTLDLIELEGVRYMVMEYVRGGDLRLVLRRARRRNQRFSPAAALYIGRELCAALEYTHGRRTADGRPCGLIHRDISPTNILLSTDGEVKLTDFGIAQADTQQLREPRARGHVGYMSPEQARGEALDARSDLFSLAAVLYEVSTDRRLFVGLVGQHPTEVYGEVTPPSQLCAELPKELDAVLLSALALPAAERPESASVLHQRLAEVSRRSGLLMDRAEFAAHLRAVCGADPAEWASLEERTATALIASISAASLAEGAAENESAVEHEAPPLGLIEKARQQALELAEGQSAPRRAELPALPRLPRLPRLDEPSEPSEPAITVPWPTLSVPGDRPSYSSGVPLVESDDTMPFPSGPVSIAESLVHRDTPRLDAPPRRLTRDRARDRDDDAVTGPAEKTAPSEKLHEPPAATPHSLLGATTAQHLALAASASSPTSPYQRQRAFQRDRMVSFAYGLAAGLLVALILWLFANNPAQ